MRDGAPGAGPSLISAPAAAADTSELVALARVAALYGGMYISHLRSEGLGLRSAVEELVTVAERASAPAEIYHFKGLGSGAEARFQVCDRGGIAAEEKAAETSPVRRASAILGSASPSRSMAAIVPSDARP